MNIPASFEHHFKQNSLTKPWKPIYSCKFENNVQIGLPITEMHTNSRGFFHGGLITALADNVIDFSCAIQYPENATY